MRNRTALPFILLAALLCGCGRPAADVLVLIDGSRSLSTAERTAGLRVAGAILRNGLGEEDRYTVAVIDGQLAAEPLASGQRLTRSDSEIRRYEQRVKEQMQTAAQRLEAWSRDTARNSRTCIAGTLAAAQRFFGGRGTLEHGRIFIVSDMVEDCPPARDESEIRAALGGIEVVAIVPHTDPAPRGAPSFTRRSELWNQIGQQLGARIALHYPADVPHLLETPDDAAR